MPSAELADSSETTASASRLDPGARTVRAVDFALEQRLRTFGAQLDVLVRAHRSGLSEVARLAEGAIAASAALGQPYLEVTPTRLFVGDVRCLEAEGEAGRWILAAFMSGVRRMRLGSAITAPQVVEFSRRVGQLKIENDAIQDFHDWLWADGAEGIEIELLPSFIESVEIAGVAELAVSALAVRAEGVTGSDGHSVTIDSRELDSAAARAEFEVPLSELAEVVTSRKLEVHGREFSKVSQAVDEAGLWAEAEIDVILSHPQLRAAVPAARLVRVLLARFASGCDARLLRLFTRFLGQPDEFSTQVIDGLVRERVGASIGASLVCGDGAVLPLLAELVRSGPPELAPTLLPRLLERAPTEEPVAVVLGGLVAELGAPQFIAALGLTKVGLREAGALVSMLARAGAPAAALQSVFEGLAPEVAAEILAAVPSPLWVAHTDQVIRLLALGVESTSNVLLSRALREPAYKLASLAPALRSTNAAGVPAVLIKPLATRLVGERASGVVIRLALERSVHEHKRLILLEVLAGQREFAFEVSRWRLAEYLDPPSVRARLQVMRRLSNRSAARARTS
jgi:hypothetical protein